MKTLLLLLMVLMMSACTSSVHMSQVDVGSNNELKVGQMIEIETSQKNILGFVYNTDYVDQAYKKLLVQCPRGTSIVNVEYVTNHGFLSWTDKIRIKAICL